MPSTTDFKRGDIVLIRFPFTDLSSTTRRAALVVRKFASRDKATLL